MLASMAAMAQTYYGNNACGTNSGSYDCNPGDSAFGVSTLSSETTGNYNTAIGDAALSSNTSGTYNTATGVGALDLNTTGGDNTATGLDALGSNSSGTYDTATGFEALYHNTTGNDNTAYGFEALFSVGTNGDNAAFGSQALYNNTAGGQNTAFGALSLYSSTTGGANIALGFEAGYDITSGDDNIDIGNLGSSSDNDTIRIGTPGTHTSFYAAGVHGVTVSSGVEVFINSSGQLGTVNSSIRFKEDVHDMGEASSAIFRLRPVTYRYKKPYADGSKPVDYGLIAEEVADVYPDLIVRGADGQIQTVQYQKLTPMLLNELQKQHRLLEQMGKTVEQQQQTMAQQQETIRLLMAQQTETVQLLEKRLAALETAQPSAKLEARLATQ
jgi:polyhydroxyalkanoate synthesis regulator phasin